MTSYLFPPEAPTTLPVVGSDAVFPVRRVYCVGRNYAAHAREMGSDPSREPPFFFCKPGNAVVPVLYGKTLELPYPSETADFHHEVELVAAIGKGGADIAHDKALEHVIGYAVGLDMTRRDLQNRMKAGGRPWEIGKAFDRGAPIGPIHLARDVGHIANGRIWLGIDGAIRQDSDVSQVIWTVAETVSYLSRYFRLEAGDLIMTGTPEGVGPVTPGNAIRAGIEGLGELDVAIV